MALQELSPAPAITGYSALGNAIAQAGTAYANDVRQKALLDRQRAQQLQDVAMSQAENDRRYSRARADQLTDIESGRKREDTLYAQRRGDQLADIGDARFYAESVKFLEDARRLKERAPFESNLQKVVDAAAGQLSQVRARVAEVSRAVMSQPPQVSPNDPSVLAIAQQLAGGTRNKEEIAAMVPKALEQVQTEALIKHANSVRAANEVLQTLRASEAQLTDVIQSGIQKNVAPKSMPPPAELAPVSSDQAPKKAATAKDIAAAVEAALGSKVVPAVTPAPSASASPKASLFTNPFSPDPVTGASWLSPKIVGARSAPPEIFKSEPAEDSRGRANEAVGDWMRSVGYGVGNILRPSSWHVTGDSAYYDLDPRLEINQLQSRLAAMNDKTSPAAVAIKNRLIELERSSSQQQTQASKDASKSINTLMDVTPPRVVPAPAASSAMLSFPSSQFTNLNPQWWNAAPGM